MASWETCFISEIKIHEQKVRTGLSFTDVLVQQWQAKVVDSSGSHIILKSEEYQTYYGQYTKLYEEKEKIRKAAYEKLITRLFSDGWETAATDEYGRITLMKRQITSTISDGSITTRQDIEQSRNTEHNQSGSSQMPVSFEQPKKSNTRLINVIIAVVLACSCCVISNIIWQYGDRIIQSLGF